MPKKANEVFLRHSQKSWFVSPKWAKKGTKSNVELWVVPEKMA